MPGAIEIVRERLIAKPPEELRPLVEPEDEQVEARLAPSGAGTLVTLTWRQPPAGRLKWLVTRFFRKREIARRLDATLSRLSAGA